MALITAISNAISFEALVNNAFSLTN